MALSALANAPGCSAANEQPLLPEEPSDASGSALAANVPESRSAGSSADLDAYLAPAPFSLPPGKAMVDIVGVGIAPSNDHAYYWFADGTVTSGTSTNLDFYEAPYQFNLPVGREATDIVGMAIDADSHVHAWYADGTFSEGTSWNLAQYHPPQIYGLPPGRTPADIVGIDFGPSGDVYTWYRDGTASRGTKADLDAHEAPYAYTLPSNRKPDHVLDMAITTSNAVYTWYQDMEAGFSWPDLANAVDATVVGRMRDERIAGLTVAASKAGRIVMNRSYGYKDVDTQESRLAHHRSRIGSVSKVITALGVMHHHQESPSFSVNTKVYGNSGVLTDASFMQAAAQGILRHKPVVALAISASDVVHAWYANGTVSTGTSFDLDQYSAAQPFTLPPGKAPGDILGVAIASNGKVYTWYIDGTRSIGTATDLASLDSGDEFVLPSGYGTTNVLGIGIRQSDNHVFVWYDNGRYSSGTSLDLDGYSAPAAFTTAPGYLPYDVVELDFAASTGRVYARHKDGRMSVGSPGDLDVHSAPYVSSAASGTSGPDWLAWYGQMTAKHLLSHSAGFWGGGDVAATSEMFDVEPEDMTYSQVHRHVLSTRRLLFAPGTSDSYSNHGLGLAGYVLERAAGVPFEQYIRDHILEPVGLDHVVPNDTVFDGYDATPHQLDDSGALVSMAVEPAEETLGLAAGGWSATADDLVHLMLATDRLPNRPDLLTVSTLDLMEAPAFPPAVADRALGWTVGPTGKLTKDGAIGGGTAWIVKFPAGFTIGGVDVGGITVAVCANGSADGDTLRQLADTVAKAAGGMAIDSSYDLYD